MAARRAVWQLLALVASAAPGPAPVAGAPSPCETLCEPRPIAVAASCAEAPRCSDYLLPQYCVTGARAPTPSVCDPFPPDRRFSSIAAALRAIASTAAHTVVVEEGFVYQELLDIEHPVCLSPRSLGPSPERFAVKLRSPLSARAAPGIRIGNGGAGSCIEGLHVDYRGTAEAVVLSTDESFLLDSLIDTTRASCPLVGCTGGASAGVYVGTKAASAADAKGNTVARNLVIQGGPGGLRASNPDASGILLWGPGISQVSANKVVGNRIANFKTGIHIFGVRGSPDPCSGQDSLDNRIEGNTIQGCQFGIEGYGVPVADSDRFSGNVIRSNLISDGVVWESNAPCGWNTSDFGTFGMCFMDIGGRANASIHGPRIFDNQITGVDFGLVLSYDSYGFQVVRNNLRVRRKGMDFCPKNDRHLLHGNHIQVERSGDVLSGSYRQPTVGIQFPDRLVSGNEHLCLEANTIVSTDCVFEYRVPTASETAPATLRLDYRKLDCP